MNSLERVGGIHTQRGRVVYPRKKHYFSYSDVERLLSDVAGRKLKDPDAVEKMRLRPTAIKIRAIKIQTDNLYNAVWDLFEDPIAEQSYLIAKQTLRYTLDNFVELVAAGVLAKTGSVPASRILAAVGKWVNRAAEYIFTGSTGL